MQGRVDMILCVRLICYTRAGSILFKKKTRSIYADNQRELGQTYEDRCRHGRSGQVIFNIHWFLCLKINEHRYHHLYDVRVMSAQTASANFNQWMQRRIRLSFLRQSVILSSLIL